MKRGNIPPFPPISKVAIRKLPRDSSACWWKGRDVQCARSLVALKRGNDIIVRGIYQRYATGSGANSGIHIEHASSLIRGTRLKSLEKQGWHIYKEPFNVETPVPGYAANFFGKKECARFDHWFEVMSGPHANEWWRKHPMGKLSAKQEAVSTPLTRLMLNHWKTLKREWSPQRFCRLCRVWDLTPSEMGALIGWDPVEADQFARSKPRPSTRRVPIDEDGYFGWLPDLPVLVWLQYLENFRFGLPTWPITPEELQQSKAASAA